ncbi:hypothetical protein [Paenibacillus sp. 32O-W]|uniref:hypothetical protein n=1 Tax=Paenibacillus sp. 32O-W TaxID=1695218 RepID=UPI0007819A20|nr:hypothetical protein [Paenibacillus sp. 32O-W]
MATAARDKAAPCRKAVAAAGSPFAVIWPAPLLTAAVGLSERFRDAFRLIVERAVANARKRPDRA